MVIKELRTFMDALEKVKDISFETWALCAAPAIIFGLLSSQEIEIFNILMKEI